MNVVDLLSSVFGGRNATRDWIARPSLVVEADLSSCCLCGVTIESAADRLSDLGPADYRRRGHYTYRSKGLAIDIRAGLLDGFQLHWQDAMGAGIAPFTGTVRFRGAVMRLGVDTTEEDVIRMFGKPDDREVDAAYGDSLSYGEGCGFVVDLTIGGKLSSIFV